MGLEHSDNLCRFAIDLVSITAAEAIDLGGVTNIRSPDIGRCRSMSLNAHGAIIQ
jgi:hypothetical protein